MKILQAFDFLSLPHGGGTVDIVYKLSKALAKRGHEVTICTGDYELDADYLNGLCSVGLKMYHSYFNKHGIYLMPGLVRLDVKDYDLIHLHCYRSFQNVVLAQKAIVNRVPYIIDAHGSTVARSGRKKLLLDTFDLMFGLSLTERSKFVIAETEIGIAEWEKLGANRDKIKLQHPLLDISEFAVLPERGLFRLAHNLDSTPIVLFLGRIHQAKGIDTLVDVVDILRSRRTKIRLVIAGNDNGYKSTLLKLVKIRLVSWSVLFAGFLDGHDKLSALVDADVLIQPSRNEAGARPSLESIMCGTPVIVSKDTGAGKEIASFDGGLLFKSGDTGELANAIQEIIDNPEESKARTEKAREYIEANLSLDRQVGQYEKLYQEAVS